VSLWLRGEKALQESIALHSPVLTRHAGRENVKIVRMALRSKPFPAEITAQRRFFIWAQIVIVFVLLEFALWAPTTHLRNHWAAIAAITLIVLVAIDVLIDPSPRSSFARLGLEFPKASGARVVLGIGIAALVLMVILAVIFLQSLRRTLRKLARGLDRIGALRRRAFAESRSHDGNPRRRAIFLRSVPALPQSLSDRHRARHAWTGYCRNSA
jgi:hypothetical protein